MRAIYCSIFIGIIIFDIHFASVVKYLLKVYLCWFGMALFSLGNRILITAGKIQLVNYNLFHTFNGR